MCAPDAVNDLLDLLALHLVLHALCQQQVAAGRLGVVDALLGEGAHEGHLLGDGLRVRGRGRVLVKGTCGWGWDTWE